MTLSGTTPILRVVLYDGEGAQPLSADTRYSITHELLSRGYGVVYYRDKVLLSRVTSATLLVLGCFDRQPEPFENGQGFQILFQQIRGLDTPAVVAAVEQVRLQKQSPEPKAWKPWFPVIDYDRCTNCMQCLSFCLFDVYGVSADSKIRVQNQSNCKTDCPACSRVCPEVAILFPKYKAGPINGDVVSPEDLRREAMKVDISALLGGDIYALLRDRSAKAKSRFSLERDEERALKERQRCLAKLQEQLDVPPEVMASLPSPDQIQARAQAARAKAAEALASAPSQ
jgi:NAD-dependent dihydropyrimidine dehydrogenase PreA subunit